MLARFGVALVILAATSVGLLAQVDGAIQGTVIDESDAAMPGVGVTAVEEATGRRYFATTDGAGKFVLLRVAAGTYRIEAALQGFTSVATTGVEVLVGQNLNLPNMVLKVATLEESVTVTGAAPLVDTLSRQVGTNLDRRQLEVLPLQGRNWMELSLLAKGITANDADNTPGARDRYFNLNVDGQQITQNRVTATIAQPRFSREAIAEFQIITNQFDVSQGRSLGAQVQAISRAGTNTTAGSLFGYFRDDSLNAPDPIVKSVVPYTNRQVGGSLGGPIRKDKLLYFFTYEDESEPQTVILTPPQLPNQVFQLASDVKHHLAMARVDSNLSDRNHLTVRASYWAAVWPFVIDSNSSHPSGGSRRNLDSRSLITTWTNVLSNTAVQEVKVGFDQFHLLQKMPFSGINNTPTYAFPGLSIGGDGRYPQFAPQSTLSARYDLTKHAGNHDLKLGGEHLSSRGHNGYTGAPRGSFSFASRPPTAELERRFPVDAYADPTKWDVSGLDARVLSYTNVMGSVAVNYTRPIFALWLGDSWRATDRLSLSFGVRWDFDRGVADSPVTSDVSFIPFNGPLYKQGIMDWNDVAPRVGFVYDVGGKSNFVIRGGVGQYYNFTTAQANTESQRALLRKNTTFFNDGLPGFMQNPTRLFTPEQIQAGVAPESHIVVAHDFSTPFAIQSAIGFQKQFGSVTGLEMDLTHTRNYNALRGRDINLFFDPVTGYNVNPIVSGQQAQTRPDPRFTSVTWAETAGGSEQLYLSTQLRRRFRSNLEGTIAYTLTFIDHDDYNNVFGGASANNQFDMDDEWSYSTGFQRHTVRANGSVRLPWDVSISGIYSYGSGAHFATSIPLAGAAIWNKPGVNRLNVGPPITIPDGVRDRFEGTDVIGTGGKTPRNALIGLPIHKVDLRLTKRIRIRGSVTVQAIGEVFNLFDHANYGAYNGQLTSPAFGLPAQNASSSYRSRTGQVAFRLQF